MDECHLLLHVALDLHETVSSSNRACVSQNKSKRSYSGLQNIKQGNEKNEIKTIDNTRIKTETKTIL